MKSKSLVSKPITRAVALGLLVFGGQALAESALVAKQLAGPPEEFAQMQPRDPAEAAIHSKSALIPVEMGLDKSGNGSWQASLPVERGAVRFLVLGDYAGRWNVQLTDPAGGIQKSARDLGAQVERTQFGMDMATMPADLYTLDGLRSGRWTLKLQAGAGDARRGFVLIEGDERTELASHLAHGKQLVGERIGLVARLTGTDAQDKVLLGSDAGRIDSARIRVTFPDGSVDLVAMHDDGLNGDGLAGDGVFGGSFLAKSAGDHLAQVVIEGADRFGQPVLRTAEHPISVVERTLRIAGLKAAGSTRALEGRFSIDVPVVAEKSGRHYRAHAEVWGSDDAGNRIPVAWIGGMVEPKDGAMSLALDERWIARAGAKAPFELRKLRFDDADHFVTVAAAERLPLSLPTGRIKATRGDVTIDETMLMGQRPTGLAQHKGVGSRLLLVHGYCSGGVWPASQFSNASTFLDANQNRTHDQFARLIQSFGNTWNSFGVVAHSQGGAASLHLYTYYWSGLDKAVGNRLIQSVGTPYQGTNLAGILATLGSWFGVGCGNNSNLNYSGASSWLSGIPTWARSKVNYYTTSFRLTNWYTNDYCNFATDLVLSDPEDGTTEQAYGQLSGAINRGHVTGQCHTAGMRDPAQYNDSSRNSVMNTNAAR